MPDSALQPGENVSPKNLDKYTYLSPAFRTKDALHKKKINVPNPLRPVQDDISPRDNLDSVLLSPTRRCAVGHYALKTTHQN